MKTTTTDLYRATLCSENGTLLDEPTDTCWDTQAPGLIKAVSAIAFFKGEREAEAAAASAVKALGDDVSYMVTASSSDEMAAECD